MTAPDKLSKTTIFFHWIIGIGMIVLTVVGFYMANTETWGLYHWHKSLGVILFAPILLRVVWRLNEGFPAPLGNTPKWQHYIALFVHWGLLLATILMPISGMLHSGAGGHGFGIFSWVIVPSHPDPANPGSVIPVNHELSEMAGEAHETLGIILAVLLCVHILGALKHHLIDKDGTIKRMLGKDF